jgi:hypothetical protein
MFTLVSVQLVHYLQQESTGIRNRIFSSNLDFLLPQFERDWIDPSQTTGTRMMQELPIKTEAVGEPVKHFHIHLRVLPLSLDRQPPPRGRPLPLPRPISRPRSLLLPRP